MLQVALIVAYPVMVHLAIWLQLTFLQIVALVLFSLGILLHGLRNKSKLAWLIFSVVLLCSVLLASYDMALYVLYLPPVIIPLLILSVFIKSLLPGHVALVTDIGEKARGPLSSEMRFYTKKVTWLWVIVLSAIVTLSTLLPWLSSDFVWSLFSNILNYVFVASLFIGEFIYRKYRFPNHSHPLFLEYIKIVVMAQIARKD